MVSRILENINQTIDRELGFKKVDFIDFTRITAKDIMKFFTIFTNANIYTTGINTYQARNRVVFVFIVRNNEVLQKLEEITKFFLNLRNMRNFFEDNEGVVLDINEVSTDNLQYYNMGVGVVYVEMVIYTSFEGAN